MRLVLFQPDIPQNTGTLLRLGAALGVGVDVIEPCGFVWSDRHLRRAGMDYLDQVDLRRWSSWKAYQVAPHTGRLVLLTTSATLAYPCFAFAREDRLLLGRESGGVADPQREAADAAIAIPMHPPARSLNVAIAAAMVLGEALRQTNQLSAPFSGDAVP
ncbi:MAG: tRNA (cytidine(34)-2'-O)-methyltransferase [Alphaproteobacteria bacterium]|nr:MAG: tRNA (cytidine(34)-2'-O)-methyltransferase [Alphaproteobacteria bacterium]